MLSYQVLLFSTIVKINEKSQFVNQSKSLNSRLDSCFLWFTLLGDQNLDDNLKM